MDVVYCCRYDLSGDNSSDHLVSICCYEAKRLFKDRIVGDESCERFDSILQGVFRADWSSSIFEAKEGEIVNSGTTWIADL